jgi:hypothetical protein
MKRPFAPRITGAGRLSRTPTSAAFARRDHGNERCVTAP